ncbi:MAG: dTDP-4-dehydrorhamnose 3,5-epimerase [Thermoleophilia bacterium]
MQIVTTEIPGAVVFEPDVHADDRGFFLETLRAEWLDAAGITHGWVQDNHSRSGRGVLRGLHFQTSPGQAKLVRCARGHIVDVVVDLRRGSPAYGKWVAVDLDDVAHRSIYIPVGLAHGFVVLSEVADVVYRCSNYYDGATEAGIAYDDPDVGVAWPDLPVTVSERDRTAPRLAEVADRLPFTFSG